MVFGITNTAHPLLCQCGDPLPRDLQEGDWDWEWHTIPATRPSTEGSEAMEADSPLSETEEDTAADGADPVGVSMVL